MPYTYKQVRDVLEIARSFHRRLGKFYETLGERADDERLQALLEYVARHESLLKDCLATRADDGDESRKLLDAYLQFVPEDALNEVFAPLDLQPDMDVDEVVARTLERDEALTTLYRQLAESAHGIRLKEFFTSLLTMEEKNRARHAWTVLESP